MGRQREDVELIVADEAALAVSEGQHEALVEACDHVAGALGTEPILFRIITIILLAGRRASTTMHPGRFYISTGGWNFDIWYR